MILSLYLGWLWPLFTAIFSLTATEGQFRVLLSPEYCIVCPNFQSEQFLQIANFKRFMETIIFVRLLFEHVWYNYKILFNLFADPLFEHNTV